MQSSCATWTFNKSAHAQRSALVISRSHRRLQVRVCVEKWAPSFLSPWLVWCMYLSSEKGSKPKWAAPKLCFHIIIYRTSTDHDIYNWWATEWCGAARVLTAAEASVPKLIWSCERARVTWAVVIKIRKGHTPSWIASRGKVLFFANSYVALKCSLPSEVWRSRHVLFDYGKSFLQQSSGLV